MSLDYFSETTEEVGFFSDKFPKPADCLDAMHESGFPEHAKAYQEVLNISQIIKEKNGKALLVGGSVRDSLMSRIPKDFDLEVYGLEPNDLNEIVQQFGQVSDVGKAFGILKVTLENGLDIDISLPRTDSKVDVGHRGFEVKTNPHMSIEDAIRRRDFTINSIAADPLTGELHDPFGGIKDIRRGVLRITDPERFRDDPLRILRALQFIGRFGLEIDKDSMAIMQEMTPQIRELPKERIGEEWKKLLLKSEKPSLGLSAGMTLGIFREIHPEFLPLGETEQDQRWHPEGDVWIHTLMTVDQAAKIVQREKLASNQSLAILLSSLCHDLGKPMVTEYKDGRIISHGHEAAGEEPTKKFLATIGVDNLTRDKVIKLVTNHLVPTIFYAEETVRNNKISDGAIRRLSTRIHPATIEELILVSEADHRGRGPFVSEDNQQLSSDNSFPAGIWLLERAKKLQIESSRATNLTRGKDWISIGYSAGTDIGELIRISNDLRDEKNFSKEMVFKLIEGIHSSSTAIQKLKWALEEK